MISWGCYLNTPLITDKLQEGAVANIVRLLFCTNLVLSYPLTMTPPHTIIEYYLFHTPNTKTMDQQQSSINQLHKQNFIRALTVAFTILLTIALGGHVPQFLGVHGGLTCGPVAFTFPALIHYQLFKKEMTSFRCFIDLSVVFISIVISGFCTVTGIL